MIRGPRASTPLQVSARIPVSRDKKRHQEAMETLTLERPGGGCFALFLYTEMLSCKEALIFEWGLGSIYFFFFSHSRKKKAIKLWLRFLSALHWRWKSFTLHDFVYWSEVFKQQITYIVLYCQQEVFTGQWCWPQIETYRAPYITVSPKTGLSFILERFLLGNLLSATRTWVVRPHRLSVTRKVGNCKFTNWQVLPV